MQVSVLEGHLKAYWLLIISLAFFHLSELLFQVSCILKVICKWPQLLKITWLRSIKRQCTPNVRTFYVLCCLPLQSSLDIRLGLWGGRGGSGWRGQPAVQTQLFMVAKLLSLGVWRSLGRFPYGSWRGVIWVCVALLGSLSLWSGQIQVSRHRRRFGGDQRFELQR